MIEKLYGDHGSEPGAPLTEGFRALRWIRSPMWLLLLPVIVAAGCTRVNAKATPAGPPLDVPAAPPRVVVPIEAEASPPLPLPEAPETVPPPEEPRRAPARPRPPAPTEAPKVVDEAPKSTPPALPSPPTLQTTPAAEQGEVERAIRTTMTRASADLNRIDYRALNKDARTQYDTAKRFIQQAEDAIGLKNLVFAKSLADKAAVLAAQLRGQ